MQEMIFYYFHSFLISVVTELIIYLCTYVHQYVILYNILVIIYYQLSIKTCERTALYVSMYVQICVWPRKISNAYTNLHTFKRTNVSTSANRQNTNIVVQKQQLSQIALAPEINMAAKLTNPKFVVNHIPTTFSFMNAGAQSIS